MNKFGFIQVSVASPYGKIADVAYNTANIINIIKEADAKGSSVVVSPELSLTAYTCQDLFCQSKLLDDAMRGLLEIVSQTKYLSIVSIIGLPIAFEGKLYNCAAVVCKGRIVGITAKSYIPNYHEFYELRWFAPALDMGCREIQIAGDKVPFGTKFIYQCSDNPLFSFGVEICEDLWSATPPSNMLARSGALMIFNLSASPITIGKKKYRHDLARMQSGRLHCAYVYANASPSESTTDLVFDGDCFAYENAEQLCQSDTFVMGENQLLHAQVDLKKLQNERLQNNNFHNITDKTQNIMFSMEAREFEFIRKFARHPFIPTGKHDLAERCEEILTIQATALARRLEAVGGAKAVIGLSGGLDSTLALLVVLRAIRKLGLSPATHLVPLTMPGFGTSNMTFDAVKELGVALDLEQLKTIDIKKLSLEMFDIIGHDKENHDVTYENVQARARTYILMSVANKVGGIVVGTGDLSEIALGWSTYNADHISMYNVNASVPKTLIRFLIQYEATREENQNIRSILERIVDFPISPELIPPSEDGCQILQKTEEKIGPYELHDYFMYYSARFGFAPEKIAFMAEYSFEGVYTAEEIDKWLKIYIKRFFTSQWKRDCVPAGPKVGSVDMSPRGSLRMSAESSFSSFLDF